MRAAREVAEKNVRNAEQEVKREKRELQQARERAARRASTASRNLKNAGLPKIFAGTMKRNAQESAGKANETHTARVSQAKARLDEAGARPARRAEDHAGTARHQRPGRAHDVPRDEHAGSPTAGGPCSPGRAPT